MNMPYNPSPAPQLRRSADRMIAGVAGGIAERFGLDPTLVRLGFVALALAGCSGVLLYLAAWVVMPDTL